jgi:CTP synthase
VSLLPIVGASAAHPGEIKTKPTQASVREMRALGLQPDLIMCRCALPVPEDVRNKVSLFCNIPPANVVGVTDVKNTHQVPLVLYEAGVAQLICSKLNLSQ